MAEIFRDDPEYAVELLNAILEDGDRAELQIALRQMAKAFGGMQVVAEKAQLNPTQIYRTLSAEGHPELTSISAILRAMGMRLAVERVKAA
jgi:probable addiction module antidote protein